MVTKAIIENIDNAYSVKVRIPLFDSTQDFLDSTSAYDLSDAIICTLPRTNYIPEVGDIVLVAFEDNDKGKPVIIGCLFKESGNTSQIDSELNSLKVNATTTLSEQTYIGKISYKELQYLQGLEGNIQMMIDSLDTRLKKLEGNN